MARTLIVFGAGPGIGDHTAAQFASKGIDRVVPLARNTQRLQNEDVLFVSKRNPAVKVDTLRIDLADLKSIPDVLQELDSMTDGEDVEVIFFNAARIKPSEVLGVSIEEIDDDFKVGNLPHVRLTGSIQPADTHLRQPICLYMLLRSITSPSFRRSPSATPLSNPLSSSQTVICPGTPFHRFCR